MNRRRILLSYLANSFSWELYSKTYFYNELVPTTINGKNVLNKAKIVKVSGNGVIENQLCDMLDTTKMTPYQMSVSVSNGILTGTVNGTTNPLINFDTFKSVIGHKYICFLELKKPYATKVYITGGASLYLDQTPVANSWTFLSVFYTATSQVNALVFYPFIRDTSNGLQVGDSCDIKNLNVIDLTLMFGTGNEPTTLTDNRIQNILNRGYIPYNLGEYKGTDIGEFKSEPYNLFDEKWEVGTFNTTTGADINYITDQIRTKNKIKVAPNKTYTFETSNSSVVSTDAAWCIFYDANGNVIENPQVSQNPNLGSDGNSIHFSKNTTFTTPSNCAYIKFYMTISYGGVYNNDICLHITDTRTGYAEHKTFTPITFKAQLGGAINSHNTMEITNSAYVFTRNVWKVDLGTLDYQYRSDNTSNLRFISTTLSTMNKLTKPTQPNLLCEGGYTSVSGTYFDNNGSVDKIIRIDDDLGRFVIRNLAYTDSTTFKSSLSGTYAYYPLATPQVITIPKKHLGIVDLGSLNWEYVGGSYTAYVQINGIKKVNSSVVANIYCSKYITYKEDDITSKTSGISLANVLIVQDSSLGTNATQIKQALTGVLLFYETENEVADIENVIDIESGGTITTDSEVLPNIELSVKCK